MLDMNATSTKMLSKLFLREASKIHSNFVCYVFKGCNQFICIDVSNFSRSVKIQILSVAYLVIEHTCNSPRALCMPTHSLGIPTRTGSQLWQTIILKTADIGQTTSSLS